MKELKQADDHEVEVKREEEEYDPTPTAVDPKEDDSVIDSPIQSPPKSNSSCATNSKTCTSSQDNKGLVLLMTPTKAATSSPQGPPPSDDMTNLKTPKMTSSSSKRPPSKSPSSSSKSQGIRPSSSAKSPKMHTVETSNDTSMSKPERQPSARNGLLSASLHSNNSNTTQLTKNNSKDILVSSNSTTKTTPSSSSSHYSGAAAAGSSGHHHHHHHHHHRRRKVQWKKSVRVNVIPNLSYFSKQEKLQTWYTADEYSLMEDECDLTSECLDAKKPLWPGFCGRGLESWTIDGEQRKEQHVQLAIDIVWQAQLDQWRLASNTDECWEFIRLQYLQVSRPCLKLASQLAETDEQDIQGYLSSVRALEKSRRKMLGIRSRNGGNSNSNSSSSSRRVIRRGKVIRTVSDTSAYAQQLTSQSAHGPDTKQSPRRTLSDMPLTPSKPLLRPAIKNIAYWDQSPAAGSLSSHGRGRKVKSKSSSDVIPVVNEHDANQDDEDDDDDTDGSSTLASSIVEAYSNKKKMANKKIEFRPKSKTKVPTSPVGSLAASIDTSDSNSMIRRMRSHLSVASDESTRRRMMRTVAMTTPL
jgi:hypothetical protein